ncbi:hypothetical protein ABZ791_10880 [Streptomyces huasconensis]|uniref:Uncharacterized protein n=1 Tax=Streptomyces huasconensis TaxID=1854574 RepID=A0ABV3LQV7_9ACTN
MKCLEFYPVIVTRYPQDEDHAPILEDEVHVRISLAEGVCDGDLILASFDDKGRSDYFNDQYPASGYAYDRTCGCGVCCHLADHPGPVVVLADVGGWCDPWPADAPVLIIPTEGTRLKETA